MLDETMKYLSILVLMTSLISVCHGEEQIPIRISEAKGYLLINGTHYRIDKVVSFGKLQRVNEGGTVMFEGFRVVLDIGDQVTKNIDISDKDGSVLSLFIKLLNDNK